LSYRRGFAELLAFARPPSNIAILPPEAPTAIGFARTGKALSDAMTSFRRIKR